MDRVDVNLKGDDDDNYVSYCSWLWLDLEWWISPSFCRWYFRKIKRIEAEKKLLLPENEHGAFLIRDSESRHNDYSLSGKFINALVVLMMF